MQEVPRSDRPSLSDHEHCPCVERLRAALSPVLLYLEAIEKPAISDVIGRVNDIELRKSDILAIRTALRADSEHE